MKKIVSILAVMTCVFTLTACGGTTSTIEGTALGADEESQWIAIGENMVNSVQEIAAAGSEADYEDDAVVKAALQSWENAMTDIGEVQGFQDEYAVQSDSKEISVNIGIDGSDHDANVVVVIGDNGSSLESITTNVTYSFGELMQQAALNTVLGMGTTFIVLIVLAALIYLFRFIPGLLAGASKKEEEPVAASAPAAAAAPAAAPAASVDHDVLVAIQAAISAYERSNS